ncbi:MAG: ATP-binding protein [Ruminococcus sp.]|nr:ATP-binding protein [Ruminococcus sp.]
MEPKTHELTVCADVDQLHDVLAFVDDLLEEHDCPIKAQMQIDVALEELFVNIAQYAYPDSTGKAVIRVSISSEFAEITLIDSGIPYDPLKKPDPDVTLNAQDRPIGGLGIFMTKKLMDNVSYEYKDGRNILTIKKCFQLST